ncbi:hypothetical protein K1719_024074 [Acacia pycnantha]|nr:hypothetical protein K1719_024074 [Acacia pycnantha]
MKLRLKMLVGIWESSLKSGDACWKMKTGSHKRSELLVFSGMVFEDRGNGGFGSLSSGFNSQLHRFHSVTLSTILGSVTLHRRGGRSEGDEMKIEDPPSLLLDFVFQLLRCCFSILSEKFWIADNSAHETTARKAGFRAFFSADATGTLNSELHEATLKNMAYGFDYLVDCQRLRDALSVNKPSRHFCMF